jgi:hypothetical protein
LKAIITIAVCTIAVYIGLFLLVGLARLGGAERPTQDESCLAEEGRAEFARCMSRKPDIDLAANGWASREEYCRSNIRITKEMGRLYGVCSQPKRSK